MTTLQRVLGGACLLLWLAANGWCQTKAPAQKAPAQKDAGQKADSAVVTIALPSADQFYGDLKLLFDLAKDEKGFKTLKETIDEFLVGIESDKSRGQRPISPDDGRAR